jgi:hypothetical protein
VTGSLTHATLRSTQTPEQLQLYYDEMLVPAWEPVGNNPQGGRLYQRTLDNGSICRLGLQFQAVPDGATVMSARVVPELVTEASFDDLPGMLTSPVVVQNASSNLSVVIAGTVRNALDEVVPDLEADGWQRRPELTDIRDESALVTLRKDNVETHVIVDGAGTSAMVYIQQRDPICGPTFAVPETVP